MGHGLSLHRFVDGEAESLDERVIREVLTPHAVNSGQNDTELLIRAADGGEAEVDVSTDGISVHRFPHGGILDIVAELADCLGAAIALPGGVLVSGEEQRVNLPDGLRDMAVVVEMTGPGLRRAFG
ncbi:hypothetical protein [Streptomyces violascens]|uniref:Uncharacterized protein n=1 Tax=Streptomyces violascens TaxID=67381 RepID=A0ABQ3QV44_9ACTN|nr:hypothetical protein [Streptomyces violascens]GGU44050.1 hypothetical protein GCM10010289_75900 [Streptomyces violascens]GHI41157.1 hypothetical protein Sviol_55650 [Streptomyces violascens]